MTQKATFLLRTDVTPRINLGLDAPTHKTVVVVLEIHLESK